MSAATGRAVPASAERVVVAPDKFKGSLRASEVAAALGRGIRAACPTVEVVEQPVADGGDGTVDAALAAGFEAVEVQVSGPEGPLTTRYAGRDHEAVVELADAAGLVRRGPTLDPLGASSWALGEVIRHALDDGRRRLVVGIGGSASTDGGAGMLGALGAVVRDRSGRPLAGGGVALTDAASLDLGGLDPRLSEAQIVVACDVDNPLTGATGAAAVYGPQKGASEADVALLDRALGRWADVVGVAVGADHRDLPGAGAAGGVGFGAVAVLGGELRSGIETFLELLDFAAVLHGSDLVVTGEGRVDRQTLSGKAPHGVARAAAAVGVPTVMVCGRNDLDRDQWRDAGVEEVLALEDLVDDPRESWSRAAELLEQLGQVLARRHLGSLPAAGGP